MLFNICGHKIIYVYLEFALMVKRYKVKQLSVVIMLLRIEHFFTYHEMIYEKNPARLFRIINFVYITDSSRQTFIVFMWICDLVFSFIHTKITGCDTLTYTQI